jgi:hypothetical protein
MTIEMNFVAVESREAKGGLNFKIITVGGVDLGGAGSYQRQQVHKMTLSLSAIAYANDGGPDRDGAGAGDRASGDGRDPPGAGAVLSPTAWPQLLGSMSSAGRSRLRSTTKVKLSQPPGPPPRS